MFEVSGYRIAPSLVGRAVCKHRLVVGGAG